MFMFFMLVGALYAFGPVGLIVMAISITFYYGAAQEAWRLRRRR